MSSKKLAVDGDLEKLQRQCFDYVGRGVPYGPDDGTLAPWAVVASLPFAPALSVLAAGLFLVPRASDFALMLVVIGAVAASAGILSPILTYWISAKAGSAQGWELGKQTAAASLGVTLGSAAGGLLYSVAALPGASFVLTAGLTVLGFLLSFGLPHLLVLPNSRSRPVSA